MLLIVIVLLIAGWLHWPWWTPFGVFVLLAGLRIWKLNAIGAWPLNRRPRDLSVVGFCDQLHHDTRDLSPGVLGRSWCGPYDGPFGGCLMKRRPDQGAEPPPSSERPAGEWVVRNMLTEAEIDALRRRAKETRAGARGVYPNLRSR